MIESRGNDVRLVQFKLCEPLPAYIALSHCWGSPATTLKTLSTNIASFQTAIPPESLATTFKHGIEVAKSLGFEYIWIDSLCIIQDSTLDWEEQSSLMAFIYSNADLVLAASSATSTADGFLKGRKAYRESFLKVEGSRDKTHTIHLKYRLLQPKHTEPMLDLLDRRAWALQERMLARRYLAFGSHEISWACMASSRCECEWWRVATTWRDDIRSIRKDLGEAADDELGDCWRLKVLHRYFGRQLSLQSDRLFAISAIASIFDARMGSGYLAGLWREDLPVGLLWRCINSGSGYIDGSSNVPSWSWESLPLHLVSMSLVLTSKHGESMVQILEARTEPSTVNQFGSVNDGLVKLWGELWKADLTARNFQETLHIKGRPFNPSRRKMNIRINGLLRQKISFHLDTSLIKTKLILPNGARGASLRRIRLDEMKEKLYIAGLLKEEEVQFFMIPIFHEYDVRHEEDQIHGLLVVRSFRLPSLFERIGVFFFSKPNGNEPGIPFAKVGSQEISII